MSVMICDKCEKNVDTDWDPIIELHNTATPEQHTTGLLVCEFCYLDIVEEIREGKRADLFEDGKSIVWQIANDNV